MHVDLRLELEYSLELYIAKEPYLLYKIFKTHTYTCTGAMYYCVLGTQNTTYPQHMKYNCYTMSYTALLCIFVELAKEPYLLYMQNAHVHTGAVWSGGFPGDCLHGGPRRGGGGLQIQGRRPGGLQEVQPEKSGRTAYDLQTAGHLAWSGHARGGRRWIWRRNEVCECVFSALNLTLQRNSPVEVIFQRKIGCFRWGSNPQHSAL